MKIKSDFVTNSSSASFYLYVETTEEFTLDEFFNLFGGYMNKMQEVYGYRNDFKNLRFFQPTIIMLTGTNFRLEDSTSMYNDYENVPYYMRHIVMEHINVRPEMSHFFLQKVKAVKFEAISHE